MNGDWRQRSLAEGDERLIRSIDASFQQGAQRAGAHVVCRVGCTGCCIGIFDITTLDVMRLRAGLSQLADRDPGAAGAIVQRATEQWERVAPGFPGNPDSGVLSGRESARQALFEAFAELPCPALNEATGACMLYDHRPVSCRTFGLPVHCGGQDLPPCPLNFTSADQDAIEAARIVPDADDLEGELLAEVERRDPDQGDSIVAAALALPGRARRRR